jgi:hypothetical protein
MNSMIRKAIDDRACLQFVYKGVQRSVEPHTYGILRSGKNALCGWQSAGGSGEGFRLFFSDEMSALAVSDTFDGPRRGYQRADAQFQIIYSEL